MSCLVSFFCGSYLKARQKIRENAGIQIVYNDDNDD